MTYCIGWKNKDAVFLLADSAGTSDSYPSSRLSSVGELQEKQPHGYVEESLLKLVKINDQFIVAFSGKVSLAVKVIEILKERLRTESPEEALNRATLSCGPYSNKNQVGLILGYMSNQEPKLLSFNCDGQQKIFFHESAADMGSMPATPHAEISRFFSNKIAHGNLPNDRALEISAAILQSFTIHDLLMRIGVGGIFFGIRLDSGGVQWQADTSLVFYNPAPAAIESIDYVTVVERDNAIAVNGTITNQTRVFMNTPNKNNPKLWERKWSSNLKAYFHSARSKFYTFFSKTERIVTVVKLDDDLQNQYFHVNAKGDGEFVFSISPQFHALLTTPLHQPEPEPNVLGFRLNFRDVHNR